MTSSSEKDTSLKPESLLDNANQKFGTWWVKVQCIHSGDLCLSWILIVKRRKTQGLQVRQFLSSLPCCKVLLLWDSDAECVLAKLLLNTSGHSFLAPLVTQARTIVPHILALVKVEPSHSISSQGSSVDPCT